MPLPGFFHGSENALTFAFTQLLLCLPIVFVNRKYYTVGFKTLLRGRPIWIHSLRWAPPRRWCMGCLPSTARSAGAGPRRLGCRRTVLDGFISESAAMILTLITLGKYLRPARSGRTSEAISKLLHLAPKTATVLRGENRGGAASGAGGGGRYRAHPPWPVGAGGWGGHRGQLAGEAAITGESSPGRKAGG